jgi:ParB/RepB/Spo0J family partition protein
MDIETHRPNSLPHAGLIDISLIDDAPNMRHVAAPEWSDVALTNSIRRRGVLQPIAVREKGDRFEIAFGRRRIQAARAAGLDVIPAMIGDWTDAELLAVQAAENLQRVRPHTIDIWRAVCDMVDAGATIAEAALDIGLDERATRRMERLGRLDPKLLELAEIEMPNDSFLRTLVNATPKTQRMALKGVGSKSTVTTYGERTVVSWWEIVRRCEVTRISRAAAIFDADAHPTLWSEDLFAQLDDEDRFTTTDVAKFMRMQEAALKQRVEEQRKGKRRIQLAELASDNLPKLPKGWRLLSTSPKAKPGKPECIFTGIRADGSVVEVLAVDVAAQKSADKERTKRAAERRKAEAATPAEAADDDAADQEGEGGSSAPEPVEEAASKTPLTKAGLDLVAAAKTAALRERLAWVARDCGVPEMLRLTLLALLASNIEIRPWGTASEIEVLIAPLLSPGGGPASIEEPDLKVLAASVLAQLLTVAGPSAPYKTGSGDAAEWIGASICAGDALPRFDSEQFLACVNGDTLRAAAIAADMKSTGPIGALRAKLIGNMPNWRPDAAAFGAPAPKVRDGA